MHWPLQVEPAHCGVGVAAGCGTHSQLPSEMMVHCPSMNGRSGPLQSSPDGHATPTPMVQRPPQVAPPHCGVGVAGGVGGTHSQLPSEAMVHCPTTNGPSGPLHSSPEGHGTPTPMMQRPLHI